MRSQELYVDDSGIVMTPFKSISFHWGNEGCDILAVVNAWLSLVLFPDFILTWQAIQKIYLQQGKWSCYGNMGARQLTRAKAGTRFAVHRHTKTASSCKVREQFPGTVCVMGGFSGARGKKNPTLKLWACGSIFWYKSKVCCSVYWWDFCIISMLPSTKATTSPAATIIIIN